MPLNSRHIAPNRRSQPITGAKPITLICGAALLASVVVGAGGLRAADEEPATRAAAVAAEEALVQVKTDFSTDPGWNFMNNRVDVDRWPDP